MKKVIGIGAAALVVGSIITFPSLTEVSAIEDDIAIAVKDACAFERTEGESAYSVAVNPGTYSTNFASSVLTVTCNTPNVYTVTANFSDLDDGGGKSIEYDPVDPDGANSNWTTKLGDIISTAVNVENGSEIMSASSASGGESATVRYSVGVSSSQTTGTYSGGATYTLVSGE